MDTTNYNFGEEFNLQVQKKFLSLLIFDQKWAELNGLDIVKPEYFENRILHNICKWIHEYYKDYKSIPTKLVLTEKTRDFINNKGLSTKEYYQYTEVLDNIFTIEEGDDFEFFKNKAILFIRQMAWKQALEKGGEAFKEGNYEQILNEFKRILSLGSENDLGMDYSEMTTEQFLSVLGETYDKSRMITTGIPGWDEALGGGFVSKNLHIIGACFTGNTKVKTNKGNITFDELVKLPNYNDLMIYSFDGKKKIPNKIKDVFETKKVKELIYLKFNNGKSVTCTPDHLFLIKNPKIADPYIKWENGLAYKQAKDIDERDIF